MWQCTRLLGVQLLHQLLGLQLVGNACKVFWECVLRKQFSNMALCSPILLLACSLLAMIRQRQRVFVHCGTLVNNWRWLRQEMRVRSLTDDASALAASEGLAGTKFKVFA